MCRPWSGDIMRTTQSQWQSSRDRVPAGAWCCEGPGRAQTVPRREDGRRGLEEGAALGGWLGFWQWSFMWHRLWVFGGFWQGPDLPGFVDLGELGEDSGPSVGPCQKKKKKRWNFLGVNIEGRALLYFLDPFKWPSCILKGIMHQSPFQFLLLSLLFRSLFPILLFTTHKRL